MRSPAPTMREAVSDVPGVSYSSFLTVPAHLTVLASMRPWKSLMPTRLILIVRQPPAQGRPCQR